MMDIISYLLELIEARKNVGISSLGTLYIKKTPGRYDADAHAYLPPKHDIGFRPEVTEELELVNIVSEKRNISADLAKNNIAEFVADIKKQLADQQYADLSPLGTFKLINDQIVFETSKKFQIGFDFYGLPNISTSIEENLLKPNTEELEVDTEEQIEEPQITVDEQLEEAQPNVEAQINQAQSTVDNEVEDQALHTEISDVTAPPPLTDPVWRPTVNDRYEYGIADDDDDDDETKGRGKRILLKTLLILFILAIAAAVVYFFYPNLLNNFTKNHQDQQVESASVVLVDTSLTQQTDSSSKTDSLNQAASASKIVKDTVKVDPIQTVTSYEVIGSAMKSKKKVEEMIRIFAKRGIQAKAIDALPGRLIKISLGTFTDYNVAKKFQDSLKIKLKNPEIYIQTIKPKN